ncbi:hypothetical protein NL533_36505, partial [Klebsiella pneumoniae]|nr:hypothetical protein [Klebsiella pneumoniae]
QKNQANNAGLVFLCRVSSHTAITRTNHNMMRKLFLSGIAILIFIVSQSQTKSIPKDKEEKSASPKEETASVPHIV